MRYLLIGLLSVSAVLLYTLMMATGNIHGTGGYFWFFVGVNGLLLLALLIIIVQQAWMIGRAIKKHVFGAKLTKRLMLAFAAVAILPSLFLLAVSAHFISYSIESWFGQKIESSFDHGLRLGQAILKERSELTKKNASKVQGLINEHYLVQPNNSIEQQKAQLYELLWEVRKEYGADRVILYEQQSGKILSQVIFGVDENAALFLSSELKAQILKEGVVSSIENLDKNLYVRVLLPIAGPDKTPYVLLFEQKIPAEIALDALALEESRAEYNQLAYAKEAMQATYLMTLIITTLMAVMLALICAMFFSRRFTAPLVALSAGTKAVAQGDYSQRSPIFREDEMGILTSSFNRMTEQLSEAQIKQQSAMTYLENVLTSLSAGVIAFDRENKIRIVNTSAKQMLGLNFEGLNNIPWSDWVAHDKNTSAFADLMMTVLMAKDAKGGVQVEYNFSPTTQVLLGKMVELPEQVDGGYMLVLDDVTELVNAQKEAAWGEVAKRLAHEIRNPLTPIQLSAERLAMKLEPKLSEQDASMLARSTDTIIKQVNALKGMVEAFRNYARSPGANLQKTDINNILSEVLVLYEHYSCRITTNLSSLPLYIQADVTMMRQVFHNLLRNAQEAVAEVEQPEIIVTTYTENEKAVVCVEDNGSGFDTEMLGKAFEPYITSKATGTGLGLAVVKKIIAEHKGEVTVDNRKEGGARIMIVLPLLEA